MSRAETQIIEKILRVQEWTFFLFIPIKIGK